MVYLFLMRKMTGEMALAAVLTTVALGVLLRGVTVLVWSAQQQYPAQPLGIANSAIALPGGARISLCAALLVVTTRRRLRRPLAFLRFGRWGVRMRAAGQNPLLAAQRGINLHAIYALAWSLSTLTGAIAGMLIALDSGLGQTMAIIGLKAFPAALVGGLDSLVGALLGSLIVASAEVAPHPLRRPTAVRGHPVLGADRHSGGAALGPVRHPRRARPCLGGRAPAAISAPTMRRTCACCQRGSSAWPASACSWSCSPCRCWPHPSCSIWQPKSFSR